MFRDGRYSYLRGQLVQAKTAQRQDEITEQFLAALDEKDDKGNYVHDIPSWNLGALKETCDDVIRESGVAIGVGQFPQITAGLIVKQVMRSYDEIGSSRHMIGDQLYTTEGGAELDAKVMRITSMPLFKATSIHGGTMSPIELGESYVTYRYVWFSRYIAVDQFTILHDQTRQVWDKATLLGQAAKLTDEYAAIDMLTDSYTPSVLEADGVNEAYRVYRPTDTATDLYSASLPTGKTNGNLVTSNGLTDWTSIEAVDTRLGQFYDDDAERVTDTDSSAGKYCVPPPERMVAILPRALRAKAHQIFGANQTPFNANNAPNPAGPGGPLNGDYLWSDLLDRKSATTWYYGAPKETFRKKVAIPFRLMQIARADDPEMVKNGTYAMVAGETYYALYARTNRFIGKCTA